MSSELTCLTCGVLLSGNHTKFCCHKHAAKWHNDRQSWQDRKDRAKRNAVKRAAYASDPEYWRNKAALWRETHPEQAKLIGQRAKEKHWASPWKTLVINAKGRAKKASLPFDLTFEWAEKSWTGFCEISRIPFAPRYGSTSSIFSPSIDRIIPNKGYVQTNCRFVLVGVNGLKSDGTDAAMYFVAEAIMANKPVDSSECVPSNSIGPEAG